MNRRASEDLRHRASVCQTKARNWVCALGTAEPDITCCILTSKGDERGCQATYVSPSLVTTYPGQYSIWMASCTEYQCIPQLLHVPVSTCRHCPEQTEKEPNRHRHNEAAGGQHQDLTWSSQNETSGNKSNFNHIANIIRYLVHRSYTLLLVFSSSLLDNLTAQLSFFFMLP